MVTFLRILGKKKKRGKKAGLSVKEQTPQPPPPSPTIQDVRAADFLNIVLKRSEAKFKELLRTLVYAVHFRQPL